MTDEVKNRRFEQLRLAEARQTLTDEERSELASLLAERCRGEENAIEHATQQREANNARLQEQIGRVQDQNRELADLIQEQEAYLVQVQSMIRQMESRRRDWRERYSRVTGKALDEPVTVETGG